MVIILKSPAKDQHRWRFFQSPQGSGCGNYHKLTITITITITIAMVIIQWLHIIIIVTGKSKTSRIIIKITVLNGQFYMARSFYDCWDYLIGKTCPI